MIIESTYGVCLFDTCWQWEQTTDPAALSKLVFSFFQISSSLKASQKQTSEDKGSVLPSKYRIFFAAKLVVVSQVIFSEKQVTAPSKRQTRSFEKIEKELKRIRLTTTHTSGIIVALFHNVKTLPQTEEVSDTKKCKKLFTSCRPNSIRG